MFGAMAATLVVALAVPGAFGADEVLFGVAYLLVLLLNLVLDAIAAKRDPDLRRALMGFAPMATIGAVVILAAGFVDGGAQTAPWVVGLAVLYGGALIGRGKGWGVSPAHFAERYGLIVIIALGESIIALGVGAAGARLPRARDGGLLRAHRLGCHPLPGGPRRGATSTALGRSRPSASCESPWDSRFRSKATSSAVRGSAPQSTSLNPLKPCSRFATVSGAVVCHARGAVTCPDGSTESHGCNK